MMLRQMKCFVAVVDHNSFTEAAEELFISQSAISQHIQALEKDLGVELLKREKRKFEVTVAGDYFYQQSKVVLNEIDNIHRETVRLGTDKEAQLRVGYLNIYEGMDLRNTVQYFTKLYPEVILTMVSGTHEELYEKLQYDQIDMVFNDQRRAFSDRCENLVITNAPCHILVSQSHYLSKYRIVEQEDLKYTPCILIAPCSQREHEEKYYRELGFKGNFLFAENMTEAHFMVISNRGYMPLETVGSDVNTDPGMQRIPIYHKNERMNRKYCAFWKKENANYYVEEFADLLKKAIINSENSQYSTMDIRKIV